MPPSSSDAPRPRVCVIGSINMDMVVSTPRFPRAGETILGGEFTTFPGGKGANQAVSAARMGARVTMNGSVGDDPYGEQMRAVLNAEGIDTRGMRTTSGVPTGVAVITVAAGGGNTIVVAAGANGRVTPEDVDAARDVISTADVVLMQLEVPPETVMRAAEVARGMGKCVMLNAAPAQRLPRELLSLIDVLIVNETEGAIVSEGIPRAGALEFSRVRPMATGVGGARLPEEDPEAVSMLERVASLGAGNVIVTFGEAGAAWVCDRRGVMIGACVVTPVDTVGAGDSFCGALAASWPGAVGGDIECRRIEALRTASAAGALATTKAGAIPSLPTLAEVRSFLKLDTR